MNPLPHFLYEFFSSAKDRRYWRIKVADPENSNNHIQIGTIILGAYFEPNVHYIQTYSKGKEDLSEIEYTDALVLSGQKKEGIIGFKDEERKIICRLEFKGKNGINYLNDLTINLTQISKSLMFLSSKEPYMAPDASLGREEKREPISLKILSHTTKLMQKIGLEQFGLTSDEAQIYLALLEKGDKGAKVGSINKKLDIKRPMIYKILDKLQEKGWLKKVIKSEKSAKRFVARPIDELINTVIKEKEEELKILTSFSLLMGESLERKSFNLEDLGITGVDKDCGLIIFEFDYNIVDDIDLIESTIEFFNDKMKYEIKKNRIGDLDDIKTDSIKDHDYLGAKMYLKFKEGSKTANNVGTDWIEASEQVAIPIDDKIYVIWGTPERFHVLLDIIKKL